MEFVERFAAFRKHPFDLFVFGIRFIDDRNDELSQVLNNVDPELGFHFMTDCCSGRIHESLDSRMTKLSPVNSHRGLDYYYGFIEGDLVRSLKRVVELHQRGGD